MRRTQAQLEADAKYEAESRRKRGVTLRLTDEQDAVLAAKAWRRDTTKSQYVVEVCGLDDES